MTVIMCKAGERAYITEIGDELEDMQKAVGGYIQAMYPYEDEVALICNEEGKIEGLPLNRIIPEMRDIIAGDFFICGLGEEDFTSIPEEYEDKYLDLMNSWLWL